MLDNNVKGQIKHLFIKLNKEVSDIMNSPLSSAEMTVSIMKYISSSLASASQSFITDIYSFLSEQTLNEEVFQSAANANKFYDLGIRERLEDTYMFEVKDIKAYMKGIDYKEINRVYSSVAVGVGTTSLSGILMGTLLSDLNIPIAVLIAGSLLLGLAGAGITYGKIVPAQNKANYISAVKSFMTNLERELLVWGDKVVEFYNKEVNELKKTL